MKNDVYKQVQRVALYIRVSTEEQALHGYSLEAQEDALKEYAQANNMKIISIYRDEGFSARKPVMKRPAMIELLQDVEAGNIDLILFTKLDRWFRSVRDYHQVQAVLDRNKVAWKSILEDYQTTTADGRLKVNIMLSVAENEADRTSERIKFVFNNKIKNGEYCYGGWSIPYGYETQRIDGVRKLVKDPDVEPILNAFFEKLLKYRNMRRAIRETNLEFGCDRTHKSWQHMVKNEVYSGELRGVKDFCDPYITREDWESLQSPRQMVKSTQNNRHYLFAGLLRCPVCGFTLKATFKTYPNDRTKEYYGYRCNRKALGQCTYGRNFSERKLEKYLVQNIKSELEKYVARANIETKSPKQAPKTDTTKLREQLRRLNVIYMNGNISDSDYNAQAATIKATIAEAEKAVEKKAKAVDLEGIRNFLNSDFEEVYSTMERDEKQRFWRSIISEVHFNDNEVEEIIFKS